MGKQPFFNMQKGNKSLAYSNIQAFKYLHFKLKYKVLEAEFKEFEPFR